MQSRRVCRCLNIEQHIKQHETESDHASVLCTSVQHKLQSRSVLQVDAKVLLGDRRLHITLARVWAALTAWEKTRLVWMFVHSGLTVSKIKQEIADEIENLKVRLTAVDRMHLGAYWAQIRHCSGLGLLHYVTASWLLHCKCIQLYAMPLKPLL